MRRTILYAERLTFPLLSISRTRKRPRGPRLFTLLEVWNLLFSRPTVIRKYSTDFHRDDCSPRIPQHASTTAPRPPPPANGRTRTRSPPKRSSSCENHWTTQLKLRKQTKQTYCFKNGLPAIEGMVRYACLIIAHSQLFSLLTARSCCACFYSTVR
jgi:hypothetical protein